MKKTDRPANYSRLAHVRQRPDGVWEEHELDEHLQAVSEMAGRFAKGFNASSWAELAGLWHDLGKYREKFQKYIKTVSGYDPEAHIEGAVGRVDHSTAGAIHAVEQLGKHGRVLAYLIAGHHTGLPDWNSVEKGPPGLCSRLGTGKGKGYLQEALTGGAPQSLLQRDMPQGSPPCGTGTSWALWIRMLFSCLVDADFLDTEAFMDSDKTKQRGAYPGLPQLLRRFDTHMANKAARAENNAVNHIRADVLRQCREKFVESPGLFSLTVPTGGGKTLSSMAFALNHAVHHSKKRVIYVIPYTSILEQTADVFRKIFGVDNVVEHHSNLDPAKEDARSRLATENWDAPIIVTTNVQFFESLFAAKTSRCRKLHNIVNSVVVLDEAQLLPPEFLNPVLHVIRDLAKGYGVSIVLSTATQPAFSLRSQFDDDTAALGSDGAATQPTFSPRSQFHGLKGVRELMADPDALYSNLERVDVHLPKSGSGCQDWAQIANELQQFSSVLCIVNSRKDCRELHQLMPKDTIHLSALMCGEHRSRVIAEIKRRLRSGVPTRVISTQLVEAGVDIDFPVVYRAMAGLDAVAQAAGRCNREGRLSGKGLVVVFEPPKGAAPGLLLKAQQSGREIMQGAKGNPLARVQFKKYFCHYYASLNDLDGKRIVDLLDMHNEADAAFGVFNFRTAANRFRLIEEEGQTAVIVRYGDSEKLIAALEASQNMEPRQRRAILRKLQRYTVNIRADVCGKLLEHQCVKELHPGVYVQNADELYDNELGLLLELTLSPTRLAV